MTSLSGAPDYNTSPLQDTRILVTTTTLMVTGTQRTFGPYYTQQNGHIFVNITPGSIPVGRFLVSFDYYADSGLVNLIDTRSYVFSNNVPFKQMLPVLGAYLVVRLNATCATNNSTAVQISVDSRSDALVMFNKGKSLIGTSPISLAAGANIAIDLIPTVGGLGMFYWQYTGTNYALSIWTLDFGGNSMFLVNVGNATAPANRWLSFVWPAGLNQLYLSNGDAGAQSFHVIANLA